MSENKKIFATPKVRKFARELGANITEIEGSERLGRITEEDVKNFEPKVALDGGYDGYSKIGKVIEKSSNLLKRKGNLILEIGYDQVYGACLLYTSDAADE